ncbi:MAG: ribonuclease HIII [Kiritimatiellae bacterium]|nr:ribonuclease HIII [Kiritimatiellia bacterium]
MPNAAPSQRSFSFRLTPAQQDRLDRELNQGNYRLVSVPHARIAGEQPGLRVVLYTSGACVAQGAGAADWVQFTLEPDILEQAHRGYESILNPDADTPHAGVDESGKGDFFGPMVIACAYVDEPLAAELRRMNVRDSKRITSDAVARRMASDLRDLLKGRFSVVTIGPRAYNRLYAKMKSVNRLLAWGHATALEELLHRVPDCPRAVADQFGPEQLIISRLKQRGRAIRLEQRTKAESDPAVAAASILARDGFLAGLEKLRQETGVALPKGASPAVRAAAEDVVRQHGPTRLLEIAKTHFRTADQVLAATGHSRADLGPDGAAVSQSMRPDAKPSSWRRP